jgi:hypothetical protein
VELPDEATAQCFENTVLAKIAAFGSIKNSETKRYWKIPECFEANFFLQPKTDPELAYDGILSSLGEGWERHDFPGEYQWAVWNPSQHSRFFSLDVRWANVERFPESWVVLP